jgi:hypothetical protein
MPRAKLKPTEEDRRNVKSMSACGIEADDIAKYIGLSEKTLLKYYEKDILRARVEATAKVGKTLFEMATGGGEVAATIFCRKRGAVSANNRTPQCRRQRSSPISWCPWRKRPPKLSAVNHGCRGKRFRTQSTEALAQAFWDGGTSPPQRTL